MKSLQTLMVIWMGLNALGFFGLYVATFRKDPPGWWIRLRTPSHVPDSWTEASRGSHRRTP